MIKECQIENDDCIVHCVNNCIYIKLCSYAYCIYSVNIFFYCPRMDNINNFITKNVSLINFYDKKCQ